MVTIPAELIISSQKNKHCREGGLRGIQKMKFLHLVHPETSFSKNIVLIFVHQNTNSQLNNVIAGY